MGFWFFAIPLLLLDPPPLENDCLIIMAESTPVEQLSLSQLRKIYLKKVVRIKRVHLEPVQLKTDHPIRKTFDTHLFGKHFDVENYWLEQRVQAGERPPIAVDDFAYMFLFVERNPGYIGYVPVSMRGEIENFKIKTIKVTDK